MGTELTIEVPELIELEPEINRRSAFVVQRDFYKSPARDAQMRGSP